MFLRLVGYVRVSTEAQATDGLGMEVQERAIRQWAKTHGHRIVVVTRDEGISGAKEAADRPGLTEALRAVRDGSEGIVTYKLDRLARALTVQEAVLGMVWRHGGQVFTVDLGEVLQDDPDDPMRTAMRQMVGVFGQLERGMISVRMRAGRKLKAERGGYAYGAPPLGFEAANGALHLVEAEIATVERITQLRSAGRSYREIAAALKAEGHCTKRGGQWHPTTIARVCARPTPTGPGGSNANPGAISA